MRLAQNMAFNDATTAGNTAAGYGAGAAGISSTLTPFLTSQLLNPQGYSQQDQTQMLNQGEAGAGGAISGLVGQTALTDARTGNQGSFASSVSDAARQQAKAAAGVSEGVAANNAGVKLQQQQSAEQGLQSLYGTDTGAQLKSMGLQNDDINTGLEAGKSGWLQNTLGVVNAVGNLAGGAGNLLKGVRGGS